MNCAEIRNVFLTGVVPSGPEIEEHVGKCARCAELFEHDAELGRALASDAPVGTPDLDELWSKVESGVTRETGVIAWLRSRRTAHRVALATVIGVMLAAFGSVGLRADLAVYPKLRLAFWASLFGLGMMLGPALLLASLGRRRAAPGVRLSIGLFGLAVPLVSALGSAAHLAHPASRAGVGPDFWARASGCFLYGGVFAFLFLVLLWALERVDRASLSAIALASGAAGLVGNMALLLHCPITHPEHLLAGHATIGIAWALTVAALMQLRPALGRSS